MGKKRKHQESASQSRSDTPKAQVDPTYGQRSFFPGLDGSTDDDLSAEAFAYLRSVRSEASGIPTLLTAPLGEIQDSTTTVAQVEGYYSDGAYIANAVRSALDTSDEPADVKSVEMIEPQTACHASLISRFKAYRSQLKPPVPDTMVAAFDTASNPIATNFGHPSSGDALQWKHILRTTIPKPTQLALMDQDTVRRLLALVPYVARRARWLQGDGKQGRCISAWIWSLLARLDELDTLSSDEVSVVRELGKHAGSVILGLDEQGSDEEQPIASNTREEPPKRKTARRARPPITRRNSSSDDDEDEGAEVVDADSAAPEAPQVVEEAGWSEDADDAQLTSSTKEEALSATLDMILTIIGECYGQRDLLVARNRLWVAPSG